MGLRAKGLIKFIMIVTPLLVLFAIISIRIAERQILRSEAERVTLITEIVRNGLVTIMVEGKGRELKKFLDTLISEDIEGIYILGKGGHVISSTTSPVLDKHFVEQVLSISRNGNTFDVSPLKINERDVYSSIVPLYNERTCQRCHGSKEDIRAIVHVEVSRTKTLSKLSDLRYQIAFLTFTVFIVLLYLFYRFNLKNLLRPIIQITNTLRRQGVIDNEVNMDELQLLWSHLNGLSRNLERSAQETRSLQTINEELSKRFDAIMIKVKEDMARPLLKIIASMEAFSEEFGHDDQRREMLKTFIAGLRRIIKNLEDMNKSD